MSWKASLPLLFITVLISNGSVEICEHLALFSQAIHKLVTNGDLRV